MNTYLITYRDSADNLFNFWDRADSIDEARYNWTKAKISGLLHGRGEFQMETAELFKG